MLADAYSYDFGGVPGEVWIWAEIDQQTTITFSGISPPNRAKLILGATGGGGSQNVIVSNGSKSVTVPILELSDPNQDSLVLLAEVLFLSSSDIAITAQWLNATHPVSQMPVWEGGTGWT